VKLLLALLQLAGALLVWWIKADADKKKAQAERKQEIKDAVFSGDVSRINAVVQRLRK
jgi:hypothetical protein